ncbi:MAG: DUF4292 domain-containing protein [Tannerellaceae bacterium]|jgi:hypothetical protein|nr:DUF4292 domain-containing protein [Tannerellaceae bacterium]
MTHENKCRIALIAAALILVLAGCRSRREVAAVAGGARHTADFFEAWEKRHPTLRTFSAKTNMEIRFQGSEMKSRVDLKIIVDSILQLSLQPMAGIEVARAEFSRDSIRMLDRLNRQYLCESYAELNASSPIAFNYYDLQAILLNQIFLPGERRITAEQYPRFSMHHSNGMAELRIDRPDGMSCIFTADAEEKLLATGINHSQTLYQLRCIYSEFNPDKQPAFPMRIAMEIDDDGDRALDISISFSKVERNQTLSLDFPAYKNYRKVSLRQLINSLNIKP